MLNACHGGWPRNQMRFPMPALESESRHCGQRVFLRGDFVTPLVCAIYRAVVDHFGFLGFAVAGEGVGDTGQWRWRFLGAALGVIALYWGWRYAGTATSGRKSEVILQNSLASHFVTASPDGKVILTESRGRHLHVWDATTGAQLKTIELPMAGPLQSTAPLWARSEGDIWDAAFSHDGRHVAVAMADTTVRVVAWPEGIQSQEFVGHGFPNVRQVAFSGDDHFVASIALRPDSIIHIYNVSENKEHAALAVRPIEEGTYIRFIAYSPKASLLAVIVEDAIEFWNPVEAKLLQTVENNGTKPQAMAFTPDGAYLAVASWSGDISLLNTANFEKRNLATHSRPLISLAMSENGQVIATGENEGDILVWSLKTGQILKRLKGHEMESGSQAFVPGRMLLASTDGWDVRLWPLGNISETTRLGPRP